MLIEKRQEGLQRVIGVPALTLSIISGVVGAGIFALPAIVGTALGSFAIIGYLVCGILFAAILMCYAEIGSRVTSSGGSYAYVEAAFGKFPAYIVNWLYFFGWGILGSAALMNIIADSLAILFPVLLKPVIRGCLFFILISFMTVINIAGVKQSMFVVKLITIIKLLPLFAIIIFGVRYIDTANLRWLQMPSLKTFGDTTLILFFAFAGFEASLGASGEIKNPGRTVPLSILIGGLVVLILYLLLQTVTQGILGSRLLLYRDAPLAAVAAQIVGNAGATILIFCAAISCFGNVLLDVLCTPRSLFAGANDGLFPKFLGKLHPKNATPYLAIICYALLIFIFSISGGFQQLAIMASAIILLVYLSVILATIGLRKKDPVSDSTYFRAPGGLTIPIIGIAAIIWLLTSLGKWEILSTLFFIVAICIVYLATAWWKRRKGSTAPGA